MQKQPGFITTLDDLKLSIANLYVIQSRINSNLINDITEGRIMLTNYRAQLDTMKENLTDDSALGEKRNAIL